VAPGRVCRPGNAQQAANIMQSLPVVQNGNDIQRKRSATACMPRTFRSRHALFLLSAFVWGAGSRCWQPAASSGQAFSKDLPSGAA